MGQSILESTKKALGLDKDYTAFDVDIIMHINSVFATLTQLGVGPAEGFMIEDASPEWEAYLGDDPRLNSARSYVYLKVRLLFDPPATSFAIAAMEKQAEEFEWRLNVTREDDTWVPPEPVVTLPAEELGIWL